METATVHPLTQKIEEAEKQVKHLIEMYNSLAQEIQQKQYAYEQLKESIISANARYEALKEVNAMLYSGHISDEVIRDSGGNVIMRAKNIE